MKALLRSAAVQGLLAWLVASYLRLLLATIRWRHERLEAGLSLVDAPEGAILLFWHGRIVTAMTCGPMLKGRPRRAMISLSRDGEFIAMAAEQLGFPAIRGSISKGGATALRQAVDALEAGEIVLITPDGPRGPNQTMPVGPVQLARLSGAPVLLLGLGARPAWRFASWDEAALPLPFATCAVVVEGPLRVDADADPDAVEATRADWQTRMRDAQLRAETLAHGAGQ